MNYNIFEEEVNDKGVIEITTTQMSYGGRCCDEATWEISHLDDGKDTPSEWHVKAVVTASEIRNYQVGDEFDFYLDKDVDIFDLDDVVLEEFDRYFG